MVLAMTEVADLEAQGLIKKLDAAYTWPHPTEPGYHVAAIFVRTDDNKPYLIYCPKLHAEIAINEERYNPFILWDKEPTFPIRKLELHQGMYQIDGVLFLVIELTTQELKKVKKTDIEKMFGIQVVE